MLFSIAQSIGPNTLKIVQFFCPHNISEKDSQILDEIIVSGLFSDTEIEEAAKITLNSGLVTFAIFEVTLFWK